MTEQEARALIARDPKNAEVLLPYVNGEDLNSRPDSSANRWIINFADWTEQRAAQYPDCYRIVKTKVKPERDTNKRDVRRKNWWRYAEAAPGLYEAIRGLDRVVAITRVSKVVMPVMVPTGQIFSEACVVFATNDPAYLALLSSASHYWWAISHASTLETRIRYTPSDVFETFPLPILTDRMRAAGVSLDKDRSAFMVDRQLGLTSAYNQIHDPTNADAAITHLRNLHAEVDHATCEAYGWTDVNLGHGHHETRQGVRRTVCAAARIELLDRLLELNHARCAEEQVNGQRGRTVDRRGEAARRLAGNDQVIRESA